MPNQKTAKVWIVEHKDYGDDSAFPWHFCFPFDTWESVREFYHDEPPREPLCNGESLNDHRVYWTHEWTRQDGTPVKWQMSGWLMDIKTLQDKERLWLKK